ncbi:MAG: serine/threonine protein kinase [Acetivibrionales bacterium]|jgi:serine/threonine protein kinase
MKIGEILDNKYKIVELLGRGGTSTVYLAENMVLNNFWAIKVLSKSSPWLAFDLEEIEILKELSHPMLPRIADLTDDADNYYIVMDYISGSNLLSIIESIGKAPEKMLHKWTEELLDVLSYLHGRTPPIIYRDLKPANLIVDDSGRLRLVDFGTARYHSNEALADTIYIGTQGYAAPEQYGIGQSDERTDLFNLGMTIIHLATGIHPLKLGSGKTKESLRKAGITQSFTRFLLKLTETDSDKRFQSCNEAIEELGRIANPVNFFFKRNPASEAKKVFKGVIGISSIIPSSGVTSFCLTLGKYLSCNKIKSVLVELNSSGDFNRLREYLDELGEVKIQCENRFETKDLTFYSSASDFGGISRKGVDVIILDLGQLNTERKINALNHADIRLVLCPCTPWKYSLLSECNGSIKSSAKNEWIYAARVSQNYEKQKIKKLLSCNEPVFYSSVMNPFHLSTEEQKSIGIAFKEICKLAGQPCT